MDTKEQSGGEKSGFWMQLKNAAKTTLSIRRSQSKNFYEMYHYTDYNFDAFLKQGVASDNEFYQYIKLKRRKIFRGDSYAPSDMFGCTCFCVKNKQGTVYYGRNFDWEEHTSILVHTSPKEHYKSISMVDLYYLGCPGGFRMYLPWNIKNLLKAAYLPFDGMNERGVAVALLRVPHAECEKKESRITINSVTAVRMLLDNSASVDEAVELLSQYNITFLGNVPVHYFIGDATGKSVVVEFLDGKMEVIEADLPWNSVSNFIMDDRYNEGTGIDRYYTANKMLKRKKGDINDKEAMEILENVKEQTVWSTVFNLQSRQADICYGENYEIVNHFNIE